MSLSFAILVSSSVYGGANALTALQFIRSALKAHHQIAGVFFYQDGVTNASCLTCPASDEYDTHRQWESLAEGDKIPLYLCVSAGLRRGILDSENAVENGKVAANVSSPFEIVGLGQMAELLLTSDRVVRF